jgi:hypothetical protein
MWKNGHILSVNTVTVKPVLKITCTARPPVFRDHCRLAHGCLSNTNVPLHWKHLCAQSTITQSLEGLTYTGFIVFAHGSIVCTSYLLHVRPCPVIFESCWTCQVIMKQVYFLCYACVTSLYLVHRYCIPHMWGIEYPCLVKETKTSNSMCIYKHINVQ